MNALTYDMHTIHVQQTACIDVTRNFHGAIGEDRRVHAVPRTKCIPPPDMCVYVVILHDNVRSFMAKAVTTLVFAHSVIVDPRLKHPRSDVDLKCATQIVVINGGLKRETTAPVCLPDVTKFAGEW